MGHSEMETFPSFEAIKPQKMINRSNLEMVPALRLAKIDVSSSVIRGEPAWLNCSYTLEGDELYSVKWYKNNVEFYRFLPTDRPPGQKYDLQGVYVDLDQSFEGYVYLKRTDLNTEGVYRCEVSAEAPSFQTVREEKEVRVYGHILIKVISSEYRVEQDELQLVWKRTTKLSHAIRSPRSIHDENAKRHVMLKIRKK
ncbi:ig-like domain-containing protein [Caerostris darwini]|uniref:Ig-like domain-containing protein n=1 Tax=Caerostris darwini TaxID=1538125 RepID=A0AAV4PZA4_9ARAC|nr:ig-like domain-containing protein [Caerostris darwini]